MLFELANNREVKSIDVVPEEFRGLYVEKSGGGFELGMSDPKIGGAVNAALGLQKSLKAARADADKFKGKAVDLGGLAEYGDSPDAILQKFNSIITDKDNEIAKGKGATLDLDKVRTSMKSEHDKALSAKDLAIASLEGEITDLVVGMHATTTVSKHNGMPDLVMPHIAPRLRVQAVMVKDASGADRRRRNVVVVDEQGDARINGATGQPMTVDDLVKEMKADKRYGVLFASEAAQGGGAQGTQRSAQQRSGDGKTMSPTQKISAGLDAGLHQNGRGGSGR